MALLLNLPEVCDLTAKPVVLEEGGPEVDRIVLLKYAERSLDDGESKKVVRNLRKYRAWCEALMEIEQAEPLEEGPPVDEALMTAFEDAQVTREQEIYVRQMRLRFKNWATWRPEPL